MTPSEKNLRIAESIVYVQSSNIQRMEELCNENHEVGLSLESIKFLVRDALDEKNKQILTLSNGISAYVKEVQECRDTIKRQNEVLDRLQC